jgi:hypothetical protein
MDEIYFSFVQLECAPKRQILQNADIVEIPVSGYVVYKPIKIVG